MMGIIFLGTIGTTSEGRRKDELTHPGNWERSTIIQSTGATGWAIPPFIVLAARYHLENWY